jgi:RNA polymerase sigma factor (sigma-70 family)
VQTLAERPTERRSPWSDAAESFRAWRDGDDDALADLVRLLSPVLWQVVRAAGLDRTAAEDVVQTTWLALVRSRDAITDPQAIAGWLCTSARREAWRVSKSSSRLTPSEDDALARRLPDEPAPEQQVVLDDSNARLWECLGRLPERCQRLLRIVAAEARPNYTEIAADLEMPVGSIGPTRGRCLEKLRHELVQAGDL